ncbi:MAG: hypothetical protein ACYTG0_12830 [Planctomycetota bacterium]|jgi:hypothetical protein
MTAVAVSLLVTALAMGRPAQAEDNAPMTDDQLHAQSLRKVLVAWDIIEQTLGIPRSAAGSFLWSDDGTSRLRSIQPETIDRWIDHLQAEAERAAAPAASKFRRFSSPDLRVGPVAPEGFQATINPPVIQPSPPSVWVPPGASGSSQGGQPVEQPGSNQPVVDVPPIVVPPLIVPPQADVSQPASPPGSPTPPTVASKARQPEGPVTNPPTTGGATRSRQRSEPLRTMSYAQWRRQKSGTARRSLGNLSAGNPTAFPALQGAQPGAMANPRRSAGNLYSGDPRQYRAAQGSRRLVPGAATSNTGPYSRRSMGNMVPAVPLPSGAAGSSAGIASRRSMGNVGSIGRTTPQARMPSGASRRSMGNRRLAGPTP